MARATFERSNPVLRRVLGIDGALLLKRCSKGHFAPASAFHKDASRADGLMTRCAACCGVKGRRRAAAEHGTSAMYARGCRCEPCRAAHSDQCKKYRAAKRVPKHCADCGVTLSNHNRKGKCRQCYTESYKARCRRLRRRAALRRLMDEHARGTVGHVIWRAGKCAECGDYFVKRTSGEYCGATCLKRAQLARRRAATAAPDAVAGRVVIFERDGYVCWLCGQKTNPDAHYLDPDYPTLDHVIPVSLGGRHTEDNLRTAHRICNSSRVGPGQGRGDAA